MDHKNHHKDPMNQEDLKDLLQVSIHSFTMKNLVLHTMIQFMQMIDSIDLFQHHTVHKNKESLHTVNHLHKD